MREEAFVNGEFYHIYNRGVDKRNVFTDKYDLARFFQSINEFNVVKPIGSLYENSFRRNKLGGKTAKFEEERLVNIICYCLNPNHYHFILEQVSDTGISEFMRRLGGGYTWYFNNKYKRNGSLFQGKFKDSHIGTNEYLLYLSAYVNLNNKVHQLGGLTAKLVKSSWGEYIDESVDKKGEKLCHTDIVLNQFRSKAEYKKFAYSALNSILKNKEKKKELEKMLLE